MQDGVSTSSTRVRRLRVVEFCEARRDQEFRDGRAPPGPLAPVERPELQRRLLGRREGLALVLDERAKLSRGLPRELARKANQPDGDVTIRLRHGREHPAQAVGVFWEQKGEWERAIGRRAAVEPERDEAVELGLDRGTAADC